MVIWVKGETRKQFWPFIPSDMRSSVLDGDYFCLGALASDTGDDDTANKEMTAAGVLLFSVENGSLVDGEPSTMIKLQWIYVAKEYRRRGLANELMEALSDVLNDNPADGILCDIPYGDEYDFAEAFFTSWGFEFRVVDTNEMMITKEDCKRQSKGQSKEDAFNIEQDLKRPPFIIPVSQISKEIFSAAMKAAKAADKTGYYNNLSDNPGDYATDVSNVIMQGNEFTSMVLCEELEDGNLHMVISCDHSAKGEKDLIKLLYYSSLFYMRDYPDDTQVKISMGDRRCRSIASFFFPEVDPILVRRGFFH